MSISIDKSSLTFQHCGDRHKTASDPLLQNGTKMARTFTKDGLEHGLALARLELPDERYETVTAAAELVLGLAEALDAVPLAETPMAAAFDARWE